VGRDVARAQAMVEHGIITRERSCEQKRAYGHRNDALHAAKAIFRKTGRQADPYKCPFCTQYHVTKLRHGDYAE